VLQHEPVCLGESKIFRIINYVLSLKELKRAISNAEVLNFQTKRQSFLHLLQKKHSYESEDLSSFYHYCNTEGYMHEQITGRNADT